MLIDIIIAVIVLVFLASIRIIGPTEVGLVTKRFSIRRLSSDSPIAFNGEAGYQARLLMPGMRFKIWPIHKVEKFPWVQIPAGEIGVVISQIGSPLPIGAKSAIYKNEFGNFASVETFIANDGQKGVQRPVLSPGTLAPIHPVAFLIITKRDVYGLPVSPEFKASAQPGKRLVPESFGLRPDQLDLVRIQPNATGQDGKVVDMIGIITTYEGQPLESGDIATRLGGFVDVEEMEKTGATDGEIIETLLGAKHFLHNNFQDYQAFLDNGGRIGLQYDPLLYGAYALNPFLVSVERVPMLVVQQGQVAVIKAYVGMVTKDTSGTEFKFGSLVRPGHRGIWQEALRTGKYPLNPRVYQAEIVPTAILTLNWSDTVSQAHNLDAGLKQITAKSREGFIFRFDLQVQIHVPDTKAPRVISMVGTMSNLVNEVLQAAVGNHFRDKLQSIPAVTFIETRQQVQVEALAHISAQLSEYQVETRGVYIQDIQLPEDLVKVLTQREIANQEIQTYQKQQAAEEQRITMEQARGTANMQSQLAQSKVNVDIETNNANAQKAKGEGEASYISQTGYARGAEVEAVGLARAKAFEAQVDALGQTQTAMVNAITILAERGIKLVPETLVMGGAGAIEGLAASLMGYFGDGGKGSKGEKPPFKTPAKSVEAEKLTVKLPEKPVEYRSQEQASQPEMKADPAPKTVEMPKQPEKPKGTG